MWGLMWVRNALGGLFGASSCVDAATQLLHVQEASVTPYSCRRIEHEELCMFCSQAAASALLQLSKRATCLWCWVASGQETCMFAVGKEQLPLPQA